MALVVTIAALTGTTAFAQINVNLNVNANNTLATMPHTGIGLHTSVYANQFGNAVVPSRIAESGVELLRYPGGSYSDIYHWSNHTADGGYAASQSHFGRFVQIMDQSNSQAMITVNYGSSFQNTMGGQPQEAAAWVAYANGDASLFGTENDIAIGVDDEGNDWRTAGYWARLRTLTAAQNTDNQFDFLAINRDDPIGIKYWEVGNEINGNGYYSDINSNFNWEQDRHAPAGQVEGNNPLLSPTAYGNNFNLFAAAMKAVDPTIKIGAVLTGQNGVGDVANQSRNWDRNVLLTAGANLDFVVLHWYVNNGSNTNTVLNATDDLPAWFEATRSDINAFVGPGAADDVEIHMTEFGYFGTVDNPAIDGVFAASTYATTLEEGVKSVHWLEMSKNSFLGDSGGLTRGAAFYGIQLLGHVAQPGATWLTTSDNSSGNNDVETHATLLPDGSIGVFIANLGADSTRDATVTVNLTAPALADGGTQWLFGVNQTTPLQSSLSGLGNHFTVNVPYRSILALVIAPQLPGDFNDDGAVDAADYSVWRDSLGQNGTDLPADGTGPGGTPDGIVDSFDYVLWKANFGQSIGSGGQGLSNIPEPASFPPFVMAAVLLLRTRLPSAATRCPING